MKNLEIIKSAKILVIGDIIIDKYIYGIIDRISQEAPTPVFVAKRDETKLGGAGNVYQNLIDLGVTNTMLASIVGKDTVGKNIIRGDMKGYIIQHPDVKSVLKTRYIVDNQQVFRTDYDGVYPNLLSYRVTFVKKIKELIKEQDIIIFSDYNKGVLLPSIIGTLVKHAKRYNIPYIVDCKANKAEFYKGALCITPNEKEYSELSKIGLLDKFKSVLHTRGKWGMELRESNSTNSFPAIAPEVKNTCGAGDTTIAVFAATIAAKMSMKEAGELSNIAAGIVVGKQGTATLNFTELYLGYLKSTAYKKLVSIEELYSSVMNDELKLMGFTNGCFDLLHPGHIHLLNEAKKRCGVLVVGINSDESISRLKGSNRPIQSLPARIAVLSSIEAVDKIVVFEEDTPINIIKKIKPDILIKGNEYSESEVIGADYVKTYGGVIRLIDMLPGISTSDIIDRVNNEKKSL